VQCLERRTLMVVSSDPETTRGAPLLSKWQEFTTSECSAIFFTWSPLTMSQARTVLSGEALTMRSQSADQCNSNTALLCPWRMAKFSHSGCNGRHRKIDLSWPPDANKSPSGLNLHVKTSPLWPSSRMIGDASSEERTIPCM
jgi:hypothetical protein